MLEKVSNSQAKPLSITKFPSQLIETFFFFASQQDSSGEQIRWVPLWLDRFLRVLFFAVHLLDKSSIRYLYDRKSALHFNSQKVKTEKAMFNCILFIAIIVFVF